MTLSLHHGRGWRRRRCAMAMRRRPSRHGGKRGRFHICHDEENTLTRLVEDWAQGVREEPDKSSVVLARTRAETRALSYLMRARHLAATPDTERVVVKVSRNAEDGRIVEPLEIAVGDRLRIGATQWEKQLFNGTIVTVEGLKVLHGGAESGTDGTGLEPVAPPVQISARDRRRSRSDIPSRRNPRLSRQYPSGLRLCADHYIGRRG